MQHCLWHIFDDTHPSHDEPDLARALNGADALVSGSTAQAHHLTAIGVDAARAQAKESDERYFKGTTLPLDGIPIAMKDLFCTKGVPSTAASHILEGFTPEYESTVSQKLWDAGAGMLGIRPAVRKPAAA